MPASDRDILSLGSFADPNQLHEQIDIEGIETQHLIRGFEDMLIIRKAEEKIGDKVADGTIRCPCHLGIGQEAIAVGVASQLRKTDKVFGAHRSHSHFLAMNRDTFGLFAEVLGKLDGVSNGMGGSMHLIDRENGFYGSVPIVGATIPIATGAGLAAKMEGGSDLAVSYFGDGSVEEGVFHESLNLASVMKLPVVFICENNLFSSHMHIDLRQPSNSILRFAKAHAIPGEIVDGNDLVAVQRTAERAAETTRTGMGPYFIEAVTYRWRGHVGPSEDLDVGVKRKDDLALWKKRDPISRLESSLINGGVSEDTISEIVDRVEVKIEEDWKRAEAAVYPPNESLLNWVYSNGTEAQ